MTQAHSLTINEIIKELNIGRATVNFILNRFSQWLPFDRINGDHHYSPRTIPTLIRIREFLDQGMLPSEIEKVLTAEPTETLTEAPKETDPLMHIQENTEKDIRMSKDALGFIQSLFTDIKGHQSRIAVAHEKRATAEERKAVAIEKRAAAEEKKADAMNNIAAALQEMNRQRTNDVETWEIAGQAAQALTLAETGDPKDTDDTDLDVEDLFDTSQTEPVEKENLGIDDLSELIEDDYPEPDELIDLDTVYVDPEDTGAENIQLDDLSALVDTPGLSEEDLDDLSALIDTISEDDEQGLDDLLVNDAPLPEPDDLSLLVDEVSESQVLDDLSSLVDDRQTDTGNEPALELDDLSQLIDTQKTPTKEATTNATMDDLSLLVSSEDIPPSENQTDLDDLSQLVDQPIEEMDDLGALVEEPMDKPKTDSTQVSMDDLSVLVDEPADTSTPSLIPDITPEQDMGKYKAAVMKIIIQLKEEGLSALEATDRLNQDQVPTISGKPSWKEKTIQKIYGFIDSAK